MWNGFEALLGRRYLMRAHRRPRLWYIGFAVLSLGVLLTFFSSSLNTSSGQSTWFAKLLGIGGGDPYLAQAQMAQILQIVQGIGLGFVIIGVLVSLFGFLFWWMTTFSAFSTFMIATGVAEVLLVLGVMNGFQGYLRSKLIDAHAHVSVLPASGQEWLNDYQGLVKEVTKVEGVLGVSPVLNTEVMLRVPNQDLTAAARLMGVEANSIKQTVTLEAFLKEGCGCLASLQSQALVGNGEELRALFKYIL